MLTIIKTITGNDFSLLFDDGMSIVEIKRGNKGELGVFAKNMSVKYGIRFQGYIN